MAQTTMPAVEESPVKTETKKASRLFFADHLRAALVILVVLHHVALVYGASVQGYYYVEPPLESPKAFRDLMVFVLFNQGWFMGAFFLLAGYFSPGSYDRKGAASFVKDRLIRLGIPLIVFYFVLSPISFIGWFLMPSTLTGITQPLTWQSFWQLYPDIVGLGPTWFLALLLIFSSVYAALRLGTKSISGDKPISPSTPKLLGIGLFILLLALASYLFRNIVPIGESVWDFPTLAYLPQYLAFYILGIAAFHRDWFRTLPNVLGVVGFVAAMAAAIILFPLAFSGQWFSVELSDQMGNAMGNGHWQSAVYALWDSMFAVVMVLASITFFRTFLNKDGKFGRFLSQQSYAVYIIHIPIIVYAAYGLRSMDLQTVPKFIVVSLLIVPVCYIAAWLLRKIPGVTRVL
jgi:glucan biosynthesis protein C